MKKEQLKKAKNKQKVVGSVSGFSVVHPNSAGIDIGDTLHYVAIEDGAGSHIVKSYGSFTCDLEDIVVWLKANGITTAAMESTGVYWLSLYMLLEEAGIEVFLVNAKSVKNVSGRKKDDTDAIWIQKLHRCGLLQKSFQPENEHRIYRSYVRQRKNLISIASDAVRRMQKALELMNIKLHTVISDLLGKTGMQIVESILQGERNAHVLAELRDPRIKASLEDVVKSLQGRWSEEYLFMLQQAYDEYKFYQVQIKDCDLKIEQQLLKQVAKLNLGDISQISQNLGPKRKARKNPLSFDGRVYLKALTGVDLCAIPGISELTAMEFIAEVGIEMSKFKSAKHFAAWLNLTPNTKITGGKVMSSKVMKKKNKAGQCLKMGASTLFSNKSALGDFYRRMRAKFGGKGAALATAHKLSRIIYVMLKDKKEYNAGILEENQNKYKQQKIRQLEKQLAKLKNAA